MIDAIISHLLKRENRANFWFLVIFLAVSLPGVVILLHRKFTTTAAPALLYPDSVSHRLAFMVPLPAPPDATWFVPPLTMAWEQDLVRQRVTIDAIALFGADERGDPLPVISTDRTAQVLHVVRGRELITMAAVIWRESSQNDLTGLSIVATAPRMVQGRVVESVLVEVPQTVRQELMACGYLRPPKRITWFRAELPIGVAAGGALNVAVQTSAATSPSVLTVPTD